MGKAQLIGDLFGGIVRHSGDAARAAVHEADTLPRTVTKAAESHVPHAPHNASEAAPRKLIEGPQPKSSTARGAKGAEPVPANHQPKGQGRAHAHRAGEEGKLLKHEKPKRWSRKAKATAVATGGVAGYLGLSELANRLDGLDGIPGAIGAALHKVLDAITAPFRALYDGVVNSLWEIAYKYLVPLGLLLDPFGFFEEFSTKLSVVLGYVGIVDVAIPLLQAHPGSKQEVEALGNVDDDELQHDS